MDDYSEIIFKFTDPKHKALAELAARCGKSILIGDNICWWCYANYDVRRNDKMCLLCSEVFTDIKLMSEHGIKHLKEYNLLVLL